MVITPIPSDSDGVEVSIGEEDIGPSREGRIIPTARRSADYTLPGSLSGKISIRNVDAHGNSVKNPKALKKLRKADRIYANTRYNSDKSVRSAIWNIIMLCEKLKIPENTKERGASLYRKAYSAGAVRGRSTKWIATACLFYAIKEAKIYLLAEDFVRALEEYDKKLGTKKGIKNLFSSYKTITKVLDLPLPEPVSPIHELGRFATAAGLSGVTTKKAMQIYEKIKSHDPTVFSGKNPSAIAVCLLYIASKYTSESSRGQRLISNAGRISVVTLRKRTDEYLAILRLLDEFIPDSLERHWPTMRGSSKSRPSANSWISRYKKRRNAIDVLPPLDLNAISLECQEKNVEHARKSSPMTVHVRKK